MTARMQKAIDKRTAAWARAEKTGDWSWYDRWDDLVERMAEVGA